MLLTVTEAAYILGISERRVYYELEMSRISIAYKVLDEWRIDSAVLEEDYDRLAPEIYGLFAADIGREGFEERLALVEQRYLSAPERPAFTRLPNRRGPAGEPLGSDLLPEQGDCQLDLFGSDGNFW